MNIKEEDMNETEKENKRQYEELIAKGLRPPGMWYVPVQNDPRPHPTKKQLDQLIRVIGRCPICNIGVLHTGKHVKLLDKIYHEDCVLDAITAAKIYKFITKRSNGNNGY